MGGAQPRTYKEDGKLQPWSADVLPFTYTAYADAIRSCDRLPWAP